MAESHVLGKRGEDLAAEFLKNAGYTIVERNWNAGKLEIDIIAKKDGTMAFVEVKTRSEDYFMSPESAVNEIKQRSIIFAAERFLKKRGIDIECRFDVITVIRHGENYSIEHIENAFYPTLG